MAVSQRRVSLYQVALAILVWGAWLGLAGGAAAVETLVAHWPIALTMVFGSFIAGATSEGGGAVAFPVFTKLLAIAPSDARVFALAIQSVGMSAATLVILAARVRIDWGVIRWASLGGLVGMVLGAFYLAPLLSAPTTRMVFTVMQATFAIALWRLNREAGGRHQGLSRLGARERSLLLAAGIVGGIASSLVGTGLDIITFSLVVLLFRVSEKVATPTSVVLMAGNSIIGFAIYALVLDGFAPAVRDWWIAAVPVVVVGAPLGALLCSRMARLHIAWLLMALIAVEVITSLILIPLDPETLVISTCASICFAGLYLWMGGRTQYVPGSGSEGAGASSDPRTDI